MPPKHKIQEHSIQFSVLPEADGPSLQDDKAKSPKNILKVLRIILGLFCFIVDLTDRLSNPLRMLYAVSQQVRFLEIG
jgi:hypothetical protein